MPTPQFRVESASKRRRRRVKRRMWIDQAGICWLCDQPMTLSEATRDHLTPQSMGGTDAVANLKLAHELCNQLRSSCEADKAREHVQAKLRHLQRRAELRAPAKFTIAELVKDEE